MVYSHRFFFSSKRILFCNSNVFGSCIIHILYTGCDKIKKIIPAPNGCLFRSFLCNFRHKWKLLNTINRWQTPLHFNSNRPVPNNMQTTISDEPQFQRNKLHELIAIMYKHQASKITHLFGVESEYQKRNDSNQIRLQSTDSFDVWLIVHRNSVWIRNTNWMSLLCYPLFLF